MSKLINRVPDFLYKTAAIDPRLLPNIQKECENLFTELYKTAPSDHKTFLIRSVENNHLCLNLSSYCPILVQELSRLNIFHLFEDILFFEKWPDGATKTHGVHRDYRIDEPTIYQHFGLNIPVRNCENTYAIFYSAEPNPTRHWPLGMFGTRHEYLPPPELPDETTLVEIDRVECNVPLWFNNYVWHGWEAKHELNRRIISIRFKDMSTLFDNGNFDTYLVA